MTDHDWDRAWTLFCDLWPKTANGMTEEEESTFRRVCGNATFEKVQPAMRALAERLRFPPKPCDLRKQLKDRTGGDATDVEREAVSWPNLIRMQFSGGPHITPEWAGRSDEYVQWVYWNECCEDAKRTYCGRDREGNFSHPPLDHPEVARCAALRDEFAALVSQEAAV